MAWSIFPTRLHRRVKEMFFFVGLFSLAQSLVTIFEPVFFYTEGIPLWRIALYYGLHYASYTLLIPLGAKFAARFGLEQSMALSTPLFVIYFLALAALPLWPQLFWVTFLLLSIHKAFYWPAFHLTFARFSAAGERGQQVSWVFFISYGVGIIGPLLGGVVAAIFGFPVLFIVAAGVALLSSLALLRTHERFRPVDFAYARPWRIMFDRGYRHLMAAMLGSGANLIHMFFWPIFVFMMLGNTAVLGLLVALGTLIATLTGLVVGRSADRWSQRAVLRLQLPFAALSFLFRPFASGLSLVALTDVYARMGDVGVLVPLYSRIYERARQRNSLSLVAGTEMVLTIAKAATAFVLVALFASFLPYQAFVLAFVLASGIVFLHWFL